MDIRDWADTHGEEPFASLEAMRQYEEDQIAWSIHELGECPDCGVSLATDDTLWCVACDKRWEKWL